MKLRAIAGVVALAVSLTACGASQSATGAPAAESADTVLKVGASPVPHAEILTFVKNDLAPAAGLKLEIVEFTDYVQPNVQLAEGGLAANFFQHKPYLDDFNASKGTELSFVTPVHLEPLGLYSRKAADLAALPEGATVAVPNDATNLGRSLKLLADNGVVTLKEGAGTSATERDVTGNPKKLVFKPLEAAQLPRSLDDVDAAVINGNYAIEAGLKPASQALALEKTEANPYVNGLVVPAGHEKDANIVTLGKLLQDPKVKEFIQQKYEGSVIPAE
ncbi:MetQ/NlpA family ABC transporter substrate-binding protein [Nonomuraea cavernae]|uniref:Lipoprotein n=1 Tax=Nonomuraea cavernae TaxID=2045107 RepID=A0A918DLY1_9ACTN|nr:MetQ/NlpA family ABC transporter substrate-binding protein [Nonomuraea cavernae]MCA2186549.1 MetQ/NlpA family ABC transporter substrate-binding protein [Nonomuraea cavernae]GGO71413.1 lipoprotein [Nonomuraea cavernae]